MFLIGILSFFLIEKKFYKKNSEFSEKNKSIALINFNLCIVQLCWIKTPISHIEKLIVFTNMQLKT